LDLWTLSALLSLGIVVFWSLVEWNFVHRESETSVQRLTLFLVMSRFGLWFGVAVALHGALDPDHDRITFNNHIPQIVRGCYAFAVTATLLFAFPLLRICLGAAAVAIAVLGVELCQAIHVLPGGFRPLDLVFALGGVGSAATLMWIGAHRARRNLANELALKSLIPPS
jgi:hypothetical protein